MSRRPRRPLAPWRGPAARPVGEDELVAELEADAPGRVLVLMGHAGNRGHVVQHLHALCRVVEPEGAALAPGAFDLAVVDLAGLRDWWTLLLDAKFEAEPTFLPVVLILSRTDLKDRLRPYWDVIDEFVTTPVDPGEFTERIALLLRARRLALAQRDHLAYVVNHDRVTGLPNGNLFMARVGDAVRDASVLGARAHVSVVHVPLARVSKSLGHRGLDVVAAKVSSRLTALVGHEASLARLTTEEWGLVHRPGVALPEVLSVLGRVASLADAPFEVGGEAVHLAPRIGVGVYPLDGADGPTLLDRALAALATARGPEPAFYCAEVGHAALRSIRTEARLHDALAARQFELWFQPQLDLASGGVSGVEALVRWRLPTGELVPPGQFLPVAEETGLIRAIDRFVLRDACRAMRAWRDEGLGIGRVSVNVCSQDLADDDFLGEVRAALDDAGVPPSCLELELTETDMIAAGDAQIGKLATLRDAGVRVAVDDFGTGYSSLAYLRDLPIDTIKIDRAFVENVTAGGTDAAITEAMVWLAERLGLSTVAEGIETGEQAARLAALRVTTAQGFLYGRPMPEAELRAWLREHEPASVTAGRSDR